MAINVYIKTTTSNLKLIASTSSVYQTKVERIHTDDIACHCDNSSATRADIEYLIDNKNKKHLNSLVVHINYYNSSNTRIAVQEVVAMASNKQIISVIWKVDNTTFNENSQAINCTNKTVTVVIDYGTSVNQHNTIKYLTSFNYYVSKHGYKTSASIPNNQTNLGSYNNKINVFHNQNEIQYSSTFTKGWKATELDKVIPNKYSSWNNNGQTFYRLDDNVYPTNFTFVPPTKNGNIEKPNYYIVIAYKNYTTGIGHMQVVDGESNTFSYKTNYWTYSNSSGTWKSGGWQYGGLRYTVYAIYNDGVAPGFEDDFQKGYYNSSIFPNVADEFAQHVYFDYPQKRLVTVYWYNYDTNPKKLFKDGTNQDLIYSAVYNTSASSFEIPDVSGQYNLRQKRIKGYYIGTSITSWDTTLRQANYITGQNIIPNRDLYFGITFENISYTITYKSQSNNNESISLFYDNILTINPVGNATTLYPSATVQHLNPKTSNYETSQYTINPIEDNYKIDDPSPTNGSNNVLVFEYWEKNGNTLIAHWRLSNVTVTYNPGDGTGTSQNFPVQYKTKYTLLKYNDDLNFVPPVGKRFVKWKANNNKEYTDSIPAADMIQNIILTAVWGSYWKKVKAIWIYSPTRIEGLDKYDEGQGGFWYPYKPWINKK